MLHVLQQCLDLETLTMLDVIKRFVVQSTALDACTYTCITLHNTLHVSQENLVPLTIDNVKRWYGVRGDIVSGL